jgi:hypothetical protein
MGGLYAGLVLAFHVPPFVTLGALDAVRGVGGAGSPITAFEVSNKLFNGDAEKHSYVSHQ